MLVVAGLNIWGWATLGTLYPAPDPVRDPEANRVVMVFGATGSALIRPSAGRATAFHYALEALLRPGYLVITAGELGHAMLEISARTHELPNGTLIDAADSIAYAKAYERSGQQAERGGNGDD